MSEPYGIPPTVPDPIMSTNLTDLPLNPATNPAVVALAANLSKALLSTSRPRVPPHFVLPAANVFPFALHVLGSPAYADAAHSIALLTLALAPAAWPTASVETIRDVAGASARSGVCGKVWKQDELAYKCKTCERDPTCVICVQCFRHGDHATHDYALIRTSGGCCDCGDVQAWRPTGFCRHHQGACAEDVDPGANLPPLLRRNLSEVIRAVALYVGGVCFQSQHGYEKPPPKEVKDRAAKILQWVTDVVKVGDGIRRAVGAVLTAPNLTWHPDSGPSSMPCLATKETHDDARFSWLGLMLQIDGDGKLYAGLQSSLHAVYFQLITDLVFKRVFLEKIVDNYERYIHAQLEQKLSQPQSRSADFPSSSVDVIEDFTVQLFTVPALVPVMIRRGGLLDILLDLLLNLFETSATPVAPYSKGIPLAQSAYANEFKAHGLNGPSTSGASSSVSVQGARGFSLPTPFPCKETPSGCVSNEISPTSGPAEDQSLLDTSQYNDGVVELSVTRNAESEAGEDVQGQSAGSSSAGSLLEAEGSRSYSNMSADSEYGGLDQNQLQNEGGPDLIHGHDDGERSSGEEDVMEIEQLQEHADHGPVDLDVGGAVETDEAENVEDVVHFDMLVRVPLADHLTGPALDQLADELGAVDEEHDTDNADSIRDQLAVFEDGLNYCKHQKTRVLAGEARESPLLVAVREARSMHNDAVSGEGPLAHTMRLAWVHGRQKKFDQICWRIVNDLKYVLTHREVAFHLLHVRPDLFRKFVRIMSIAQGMNSSARRFRDHVLIEGDSWAESFTIEIEFYYYVELLSVAFCASKPSSNVTSSDQSGEGIESIDLPASRLRCISIVRSCLDEWLDREEAMEARSTFSGEDFTVAHSVSVHLPLHRFLAFMVHHVVRLDNVSLSVAMSGGNTVKASPQYALRLLRHPLRIQAFLSQVRAGMWKRNGHPVVGQAMFYRSILCSEWFVDLDLFLQQCCAVLLGPGAFLQEVLHAFRVSNFAAVARLSNSSFQNDIPPKGDAVHPGGAAQPQAESSRCEGDASSSKETHHIELARCSIALGFLALAPKRYAVKGAFNFPTIDDAGNSQTELAAFAPTLLEDLLVFIVRITSERSRCGAGEAEFLRRKLVHQLCSRDRTHSQLYRACPYRICNELNKAEEDADPMDGTQKSDSLVESTLFAIADYIEPKGMDQGKYRLKAELWQEFDPFTPHMMPRERCAAEVRHAAVCKKEKRKMQVISSDVISARSILPQLSNLLDICPAVCQVGAIATEMLRKALPGNGGPNAVEGAISAALHLVCTAVECGTNGVSGRGTPRWLNECLHPDTFSDTAIGVVCEMYKLAVQHEGTLYNEFVPVLERVLRQATSIGGQRLETLIAKSIPVAALRQLQAGYSHTPSETSIKPGDERRRILLQKKKEQQAAAMTRMRLAQESFAKHMNDTKGDDAPKASETRTAQENHAVPFGKDRGSSSAGGRLNLELGKLSPSSTGSVECTGEECALCHEVESGDGAQLIGLIGFYQKTRLPAIARKRCEDHEPSFQGSLSPLKQAGSSSSQPHQVDRSMKDAASSSPPGTAIAPEHSTEVVHSFLLNQSMLSHGVESTENLHISFCGHAIHIHCFDRYFSSLLQSRAHQAVFEGYNLVNLDRLEFLCPVCRRLANMVLPLMGPMNSDRSLPTADSGGLGHIDLCFVDWFERCNLEIKNGWTRVYSDSYLRATKAARTPERFEKEELVGAAGGSARFKLFLSRGRAVLQRFGLQNMPSPQSGNEMQNDDALQSPTALIPYTKLPSAAVATVACIEIAARSEVWGGSSSLLTLRSLGTVLREARAQVSLEPVFQRKGLSQLWQAVTSAEQKTRLDPFVTFCFLFLLWPDTLNFNEVKGIAQLCFDLIRTGSGSQGEKRAVASICSFRHLLYLRRIAIMVSSFFNSVPSPLTAVYGIDGSDATEEEVSKEARQLMDYFDIQGPGLSVDGVDTNTCHQDHSRVHVRPRRVGLIKLPRLFQSILEDLDGKLCAMCSRTVKGPALCLVCGALMCSSSKSCKSGGQTAHSNICGAGIGVFLILKSTGVHIIRRDRLTLWGSPYLDAHGEEDKKFSRGKPLFLNYERYASLERLWLTHGFDQDSRILNATMPVAFILVDQEH